MSALLVKKPDLPLFLRFDPTFLLHIFLHARPNGPQHSRQHHDKYRIFPEFPEEYHGDHEDHHQTPVGVEMELRLPQKAVMRMEIPAEAIMATTAGRREPRIPWSIPMFRYLR